MKTKTALITLLAAAALAAPGSALAWFGHHHAALFAKLSGTGTSLGDATATATGSVEFSSKLSGGSTFGASFSTNWSQATTKTTDFGTLTCAPSNATVVLHDANSSSDTLTGSLSGRACTFTKTDGTVFRGFVGRGTASGAGTLGGLSGVGEKAFFLEKPDGTVKGMALAGFTRHEGDDH